MKHFFDVGADAGRTFDEFLLPTDRFNGYKVWCFEPSPHSFAKLLQRIPEFSPRFDIVACNFGLGGSLGSLPCVQRFYQKSDSSGDSFFPDLSNTIAYVPNLVLSYTLLSAMVPLASLLEQHIPASDTVSLKLDCEGSEYSILEHLLHSHRLFQVTEIMVEFHNVFPGWEIKSDSLRERYAQSGKPLIDWIL